jgi:hypothetical protein
MTVELEPEMEMKRERMEELAGVPLLRVRANGRFKV